MPIFWFRGDRNVPSGLDGSLRTAARGRILRGSLGMNVTTIPAPPVKAANQLLHSKAKIEHLQCALCRSVATNPIAVDHDQRVLFEVGGRLDRHRTMRDVECARNMPALKGLRGSRVDDNDSLSGHGTLNTTPSGAGRQPGV